MKSKVQLKPISQVCDVNPRFVRNGLENNDLVSFLPMASVDEISGKIISMEERSIQELIKGYTPFKENDVLFAKITPCMENGKATIARDLKNYHGFGSTEFHVLRVKEEILPEWIFYLIRTHAFRQTAENNMTGSAGQKRVL